MIVQEVLRTNQLVVRQDDTLSRVFGKFSQGHTEAVVVDKDDEYVGMLWKRALIRSRIDPATTKVGRFVAKTAMLLPEMPLVRAAFLMYSSDAHVLPVLDKKRNLLGIAGARDVIAALQDRLAGKSAAEACTQKLTTLKPADSVGRALTLFREKKIDRIPIVDERNILQGIVSLTDVLGKFFITTPKGSVSGRHGKHGRTSRSGQDSGERPDYTALPVKNVMTKSVVTASPKTSCKEIAKLMLENEISDVVLVQNEKAAGIITTKDLLYEVALQ